MKIDSNKWINTLHSSKIKMNNENNVNNEMDPTKWISTLPSPKKINNSSKKYTVTATLFVVGLILVTVIKNETRSLQKEINNMQSSINILKDNLHNAILDYQFITSPANVSLLAKEHLEYDFVYYKKSQITKLNNDKKYSSSSKKNYNDITLTKKKKILSDKIRLQVAKKIEMKKNELLKLQEMYTQPKKLPKELKTQVANKIEKTKNDLKKLYSNPNEAVDAKRVQRWAVIQVVKAFFGMPIVPGK